MTARRPALDELVATLNPVSPQARTDAQPLDARARADLGAILAAPVSEDRTRPAVRPVRPLTRGWRLPVVVMAAAVVAALFALTLRPAEEPGGDSAFAATPAQLVFQPLTEGPDAPRRLRAIAERVQALPDDTGRGGVAHVTTQSWSLFTRIDGRQVTSRVVPQHTETWLAGDGSGTQVVTETLPGGRRVRDETELGSDRSAMMWPLRSLSPDDVTLARQLRSGHPAAGGAAEMLVAVTDAYREMPIPPTVRAALLRYLAAVPGLRASGSVTDRLGRDGLGFSVDSTYSGLPTRYTLIVSARDGRVLGSEEMLTTTAGALHVPIPSVIAYTAFVAAGYTDRIP